MIIDIEIENENLIWNYHL